MAHAWRDNDAGGFPWHGPSLAFGSAGDIASVALIESSLGGVGKLELIAREGDQLFHNWRDDGGSWRWQKRTYLPGGDGVVGSPGFAQSSHGTQGNFEVVAPFAGGLAHWWRDNDDPSWHWWGPYPVDGTDVDAVALIHSTFGKLELVARTGDQLLHYWRDDGATWAWNGPFPIASGVAGTPALVQSSHGAVGNLEVVTPLASGGLAHLWRDMDDPGTPWSAPTPFGSGTVDGVGLVHSSFDNLELVARLSDQLAFYWRADGTTWAWNGPFPILVEPTQDPALQGECTIPFSAPVVGIHTALLRTGELVLFAYSDFSAVEGVSGVLDPLTGATRTPPESHHLFCSGHTFLADGRLLTAGGHHTDLSSLHIFDPEPSEQAWLHIGEMANGRWYPTCATLPNGQVLIISGTEGQGGPVSDAAPINNTIEVYDASAGIGPELPVPAPFSSSFPPSFPTIDLYPFVYVLPSGKLLVHSRNTTRFYDPATDTWEPTQLPAQSPVSRTYPGQASSVLLPLLPTSSPPYSPRIVIFGGGGADPDSLEQFTPATDTVELLDLGDPAPAWRYTMSMSSPRVLPDAVLLPDGTVLVVGGSATGRSDVGIDPVLQIALFDPATEGWSAMCPAKVPRLYHATAILLPDARVLMAGTDGLFNAPPYDYPQHRIEIFSPPYLFRGPRPTIAAAPTAVGYGGSFGVDSPDAADVASAILVRPGSVTHSFNMEQRLVGLVIESQAGTSLSLQAPPDGNVAPPGYYLLFLLNGAGVPSGGEFVRLD